MWFPSCCRSATVQRVLQNLLRERVSIRDAVSILEALGEAGGSTRNPVLLTEYVRQSIRRAVVETLSEPRRRPACVVHRPGARTCGGIRGGARRTEQSPVACRRSRFGTSSIAFRARIQSPETPVVAITSSGARYFLRQIGEPTLPNLFFLAHNEVPRVCRVQSLGNIQ